MNDSLKNNNTSTKRLKENEKFIPYSLIKDSISETNLTKETIEENSTNLFYETLSGKGKLFLKSGFLYYGPVKYGILTSEDTDENCEIKFPDGTIYVGEMKDNQITGTGKYYFPTGAIYSGELLSGLRHGYGIFESPNEGLIYEGNWKKGLKNGNGRMKKRGCIYEGNWKDGSINGRGKLTWESGNIYKGDFVKGKLNGDGYMIWYNESKKYTGHWENNLQNGYGIQIWYEGKGEHKYLFNRYIGEWKNGKRNGYGIFYYSNGAKYEGTWKDDSKDGFGIFTFHEGKKFMGLFKDDHFCGNIQNQISESVVLKYLNDYKSKFLKPEKSPNSPKKGKRKSINTDIGFGNHTNKAKLSVLLKRETKATLAFTNNINNNNLDLKSQDKKENEKKQNLQNDQNQNASNIVSIIPPENLPSKMKNINFDKFHTDYQVKEENSEKFLPKTKQNKSLNRFIPFLQYKKVSFIQPDIFEFKKDIENIILQNLTEIRRWYQYSNRLVLESEETRLKREQKIFSPQECVYTNKVYLCMELKDLWRIFRDSGIMSAQFSLSCFDRMFYYDEYNKTDILYIKNISDEQENIYKEVYEKLTNFKNNFAFENQAYVLYYYMTENSEINKYLFNIIDKYKVESNFNNNSSHDIYQSDKANEEIHLIDKYDDLLSEKDIKYEKTNKLCFDINNSHNPLLLYQFYNSLLYASILYFSFSPNDLKAYEKFKRIIDFINSSKPNFKRGGSKNKTGMSKLESSFVNKANEALNEAQRIRNYDYLLIDDFYKDYSSKLIPIFEKLFILSKHGRFYNKNDKTLDYSYFYYNIVKKIELLKDIFKNKLAYIEIISHFHSSIIDNSKENNAIKNVNNNNATKNDTKVTKKESENININNKDNILGAKGDRNENNIDNKDINDIKDDESDSDIEKLKQEVMEEKIISTDNCEKYRIVEDLLYNEMNFYEFVELIFFICRKYYLNKYPNAIFIEMQVPKKEKTKEKQKEKQIIKQREKDTFMKIINLINQEVHEFEKKSKDNTNKGKFKYKFPELKSHLMKKEQIKKEEKKKELMKLKEKEIKRYNLERENLAEEDKNVYFEEAPEEIDDTSEDEF